MRSISSKITLVLIIVSVIGAIFTAFFIQNRTKAEFDKFIRKQEQEKLTTSLITDYKLHGNWKNAPMIFQEIFPSMGPHNMGGGQQGNPQGISAPFILTSPDGKILDTSPGHGGPKPGGNIPMEDVKKGIPLEVDDEIVGWLVPAPAQRPRNTIQEDFLGNVEKGLIISSIVTLLIALALGGILIQSFTRPIRDLAKATAKVADGELGYQVDIQSRDEIGDLAASFNNMSRDLQKADLSRKQMTADIAHDLRTPLTLLQGYTEVLSDGKMKGSSEIFQTMHRQAQHLSYLIDDLKTLSLLDSNELPFQIQNIDPGPILLGVETAFKPLAEAKHVQIRSKIDHDLPRVNLDPDRLNQILGNLITNSLDVLSDGGEINLSCKGEGNQLVIDVSDNGPGISDEDLPKIFDRSFRTDQARTGYGSSGLGLAITRKLIQAQDGEITVNSTPDQGTEFTIRFPAA